MVAFPRQMAAGRAVLTPLPLGLLAALAMAVGLVWLSFAVDSSTIPSIDLSIMEEVQSISFFGWETLLDVGERLTGSPVGPAVWVVFVLLFWLAGRPVESLVLAAAAVIWVPKAILEEIVARPRPPEELLTINSTLSGLSFPSGHITAGVAVFGMLAIIAIVRLQGWRTRSLVFVPVGLILALSALSRVADGAHWPSDVLGGFLLGGVWLLVMAWVYRSMRHDRVPVPGLGRLKALRAKPTAPSTGVRLAGSIASTVYLDDRAGTAVKVYRPSRPVRLMYWAAFQAPFPYSSREEALNTAASIRKFTGLLTQFWTGHDMVAGVQAIRREGGEFHFVTDLVSGEEPADNDEIKEELATLRRYFSQAGLPTWQIDPDNPHAHTNFIRTKDGQLKIIDLESTLIPLIQPLGQLPRMLRSGRMPTFDDVDFNQLNSYVKTNEAALRESLGPADFDTLEREIAEGAHAKSRVEGRRAERVGTGGAPRVALGRLGPPHRADAAALGGGGGVRAAVRDNADRAPRAGGADERGGSRASTAGTALRWDAQRHALPGDAHRCQLHSGTAGDPQPGAVRAGAVLPLPRDAAVRGRNDRPRRTPGGARHPHVVGGVRGAGPRRWSGRLSAVAGDAPPWQPGPPIH